MRAHEFQGTRHKQRPKHTHYCDACDRVEDECVCDQEQLDELTFMGISPCTKDCSGHRAGYQWSKKRGGVSTASWSDSFNKGAEIAKAGY